MQGRSTALLRQFPNHIFDGLQLGLGTLEIVRHRRSILLTSLQNHIQFGHLQSDAGLFSVPVPVSSRAVFPARVCSAFSS